MLWSWVRAPPVSLFPLAISVRVIFRERFAMMKRFAISGMLALLLAGCVNNPPPPVSPPPPPPPAKSRVEVHAPGVDVNVNKGGVDVKAPGTDVEVDRKPNVEVDRKP